MGLIGKLLGTPLGYVMYFIYHFVNNYGVALILFTLLSKLIVLPFSYKQQLSSVRQQSLNPKISKLKKQYANNPQKFQEEQQKLLSEEGINPMSGCISLIPSMIILYGIIDVVYRPLTHILRIKNDVLEKAKEILVNLGLDSGDKSFKSRPELSVLRQVKEHSKEFIEGGLDKDVVDKICGFNNTFLGVDFSAQPTIHPDVWNKSAVALIMIPILSGVVQIIYSLYSQYKQRKMNPDAAKMQGSGCMMLMTFGMPLFSVWLAFTVPAGVGFYWIWSSVFAFLQSFLIYMYLTPKRLEVINARIKEKNKNNPGLMQRMLEQQNEMMKQQSGSSKYNADTEGMSRAEKQNYNRQLINEARKRMAEKYGEEYNEEDDEK